MERVFLRFVDHPVEKLHRNFEMTTNLFDGTIVRRVAHLIIHAVCLKIQKSSILSTICFGLVSHRPCIWNLHLRHQIAGRVVKG